MATVLLGTLIRLWLLPFTVLLRLLADGVFLNGFRLFTIQFSSVLLDTRSRTANRSEKTLDVAPALINKPVL